MRINLVFGRFPPHYSRLSAPAVRWAL